MRTSERSENCTTCNQRSTWTFEPSVFGNRWICNVCGTALPSLVTRCDGGDIEVTVYARPHPAMRNTIDGIGAQERGRE